MLLLPRVLACALAAVLVIGPETAGATVVVAAALPAPPAPFANAITAYGVPSSLTVTVTNSGTQNVHRIDFQLPNANYTATGGTPPNGNWTVIRFTAPCSTTGLAAGTSANFVINLTPPNGDTPADTTTSAFTVTARTAGSGGGCPSPSSTGSTTFTAGVKALYLTGSAAPANGLGVPMTGVVTWSVTNESSATQTGVTASPVVITPSSGISGSCTTIASLASHGTGTVTCTYAITTSGSYSFAANARNTSGTATAVGASAGTINVGTSNVSWTKSAIAVGRPATYTLALTVNNVSATSITRVDVTNAAPSGWTLSTATATNGLSYAAGSSSAGDVVFTGTLAGSRSSNITITFSAVPSVTATTSYSFGVKLTPTEGSTYALNTSHAVVLVVPISDVAGLTILASSSGQTLAWTNTSANGSTHDGVVVFRAAAGTVPATPVDFTVYSSGSGGVVYADSPGSTTQAFIDSALGSYNYRVCNRDAYYVYSSCNTGFWNNAGWLDSESYPAGGWVHALGGDARLHAGLVPGSRIAQANNSPSIAILDVVTGQRSFDPIAIPSLPSVYTPAVPLANGRKVLFAADQSGDITAVDLDTGSIYWQVNKAGESFVAGVAGITRATASAAFKAAYSMDVLLLGSTTGTVYAVDATTGATLWTVAAGAPIYALLNYDRSTDMFWVPTTGAGVKAYSMAGSSPTVAAVPAPGWNPDPSHSYRLYCARLLGAATVTCLDTSGVLQFLDQTTGAPRATPSTGVSSPTALVRIPGGLVVSSATAVQVLSVNETTFGITSLGIWAPPGLRISTPVVFTSSGFLVVGGNDRRLHKISLANATELAQSPQVTTQAPGMILAQPVYDGTSGRYLFGTSDGHLWAIPTF
jgi:hypothetical protein